MTPRITVGSVVSVTLPAWIAQDGAENRCTGTVARRRLITQVKEAPDTDVTYRVLS